MFSKTWKWSLSATSNHPACLTGRRIVVGSCQADCNIMHCLYRTGKTRFDPKAIVTLFACLHKSPVPGTGAGDWCKPVGSRRQKGGMLQVPCRGPTVLEGRCAAQLSNAFCPVYLNWRTLCLCKAEKHSNCAENLGAIVQNVVAPEFSHPCCSWDGMWIGGGSYSCRIMRNISSYCHSRIVWLYYHGEGQSCSNGSLWIISIHLTPCFPKIHSGILSVSFFFLSVTVAVQPETNILHFWFRHTCYVSTSRDRFDPDSPPGLLVKSSSSGFIIVISAVCYYISFIVSLIHLPHHVLHVLFVSQTTYSCYLCGTFWLVQP
jgi:hypothetical protein